MRGVRMARTRMASWWARSKCVSVIDRGPDSSSRLPFAPSGPAIEPSRLCAYVSVTCGRGCGHASAFASTSLRADSFLAGP